MRTVLNGHPAPWRLIENAFALNLVWGLLAAGFYAANLRHVRKTGLLVKVATQ